jgi:hypothetical protein
MPEGASGMEAFWSAFGIWLVIYVLIMTAGAVLLLLVLLTVLTRRLDRISKKLDEVYDSASSFVQMGLQHFQKKKH